MDLEKNMVLFDPRHSHLSVCSTPDLEHGDMQPLSGDKM